MNDNHYAAPAFAEHRRYRVSLHTRFSAYVLGLFLISLVSVLPGHSAVNTRRHGDVEHGDERQAVAQIAEIVATAWNKNDSEAIARLFLPDATLIMPTGSVVYSRAAIKKRLIDERNGKLKNTILQNTIAGVFFPNKQAAIVQGNYRLHGMKILGVESSPAGRFVFHQSKRQGQWMISKAEILRQNAD